NYPRRFQHDLQHGRQRDDFKSDGAYGRAGSRHMIRNATSADIAYVLEHIRAEDRYEIEKITKVSAEEAIASIDSAPYLAFVIYRDEPVAIFGAMLREDGKSASMFRFATDAWPAVVKEAIRFGRRQFIDAMRKAGIEHLYAATVNESDTEWLRL